MLGAIVLDDDLAVRSEIIFDGESVGQADGGGRDEFVLRNAGYPIAVLDLCAALRVSRRTLHTAFTVITGQSPVAYLRSIRLGQVRKLLRTTAASQMTIASAAARCGFIHLGNFASDYRQLFGELPSQSLRRHVGR